jgi:hypothetical protein
MSEKAPETPRPVEIEIKGKVQQQPRSDGYRPISDPQWVWGQILGVPSEETWRTFWSAVRRLDTGHRQVERIREAIEELPPLGSPAGRQAAHEVLGDAELAIWALDKALDIAVAVQGRYRIEGPFPRIIGERRPLVAALRDHYSHIDERALGMIQEEVDPTAEEAFEFAAIIGRREFSNGRETLGIDQEATDLCIATRDYLVRAWGQVTAEVHRKRQAETD